MTASSIPAGDGQHEALGQYVEEPELAKGLAALRRRTSMVPTEKWLAVAGGVLMPLGVLLVIAGWFGAAHTTRLFEEVPYLISGGLLGIVLTTVGAALYFGVVIFNLAMTFWIGEPLIGWTGLMLYLPVSGLLWLRLAERAPLKT